MSDWRDGREYREWREAVIRRDVSCIVPGCGSYDTRHAHHLYHATFFPELRFDTGKGVCMCAKCHCQFHTNYHRSYREKCTEDSFLNFLSLARYLREMNQ